LDRNTVIGLTLMFAIMMGWFVYMTPSQEDIERMREERRVQDSIRVAQADQGFIPDDVIDRAPAFRGTEPEVTDVTSRLGVFGEVSQSDTLFYAVSTPLFDVIFTNLGAGPSSFTLAQYSKWDGTPVQLIADSSRSTYSVGFVSTQNYNIETDQILFRPLNPGIGRTLNAGEAHEVGYTLEFPDGERLVYIYTVNGNSYEIGLEVRFEGAQRFISDRNIEFAWKSRLNPTERSRSSEAMYTSSYVYSGGVLEQYILTSAGREESIITGNVDWVSTKTKFFTQIIKPELPGTGAIITSEVTGDVSNELTKHHYTSTLRTRIPDTNVLKFNLYVGPLQYYTIRDFDPKAYDMVDVGYKYINWFSEPLVKYVVLPVITTLGDFFGNYGIAIIIFAFLIKLVLYPLTKKSFESMAAMGQLQPEMKLLQEKYKDDPKKQQEATMALFKKAKVNPLGGCLPNLLQIPVLVTLWKFFQNAIEIRGESFLWASDLSAPDVIINLPFSIPFMGDFIAGFVLLMSASMVIQMRISGQGGAANPQMKIFQYIFPVMMLLIFNAFASGLSLYYLIYNVLSIGQQMLIKKKVDHVGLMESIDKKKAKEMAKEQAMEKRKEIAVKKGQLPKATPKKKGPGGEK
jgi:YidC/Oxa1 family membrane protein insertase